MKNLQCAQLLFKIADLLELEGVEWKPRAFRRAAQSIELLDEDVCQMHKEGRLEEISGVGKGISQKIAEFCETGTIQEYEELKKKLKIDIEQLEKIPQLGPSRIRQLYKKLGIKNLQDLEERITKGEVQKLDGFGEKLVSTIQEGIELLKRDPGRMLYERAVPIAQKLLAYMKKCSLVKRAVIAGSFRRKKLTIGDLDLLVESSSAKDVMDHFISFGDVATVLAKGEKKTSIRLTNDLQVDLRVVSKEEFGAALLYFTGSKDHNVKLRRLALRKGYTLNEYGLFTKVAKKQVAGKTEKDIYTTLGLRFIAPEKRLGENEIELAKR